MRPLALSLVAIALASSAACDGCAPPGPMRDARPAGHEAGVPATNLDTFASTIVATPTGGLVADGVDVAALRVTLLDTMGAPLAGVAVRLAAAPATSAVLSSAPPTDEEGVTTATLAATEAGDVVVTAYVATAGGEVPLERRASVSFWPCRSLERHYDEELLPTLAVCLGCHNDYGRAPELGGPAFALPGDPGAREWNLELLRSLALETAVDDSGAEESLLLVKPMGGLDHGGGQVLREGDAALWTLRTFVDTAGAASSCAPLDDDDAFAGVTLLDPTETYRKARWALTGEIASAAELDAFGGAEADLDAALDDMLASDAFGARLMDLAADLWLTDRDNDSDDVDALDALEEEEFPNRFYFHPCDEGFRSDECCAAGSCCKDDPANAARFCELGQRYANEAVARQPLRLLRHVVENDRSFQETVTASYALLNPYSARVFGVGGLPFDDDPENDREEWLEAQIEPSADNGLFAPRPSAGILTTPTWLERYPTTRTNVNRHRARVVYEKLLDIDVMTFMQLVIDQSEPLGEDPFRDARTCSACHAALDPVAGTFQNWHRNKGYVDDGWEDWMRLPGFRGEEMPASESSRATSFLAAQVAGDPRFAVATARQWLGLLTGAGELTLPTNPELDDHRARLRAFRWQTRYLDELAADFSDGGYRLKDLLKDIVRGPFFRAAGAPRDDERQAAWSLLGLGRERMLTPEDLDRKLRLTTGYFWTSNRTAAGRNMLTYRTRYPLLLGGVDNDVITARYRDPFPIALNITRRLATEMACLVVPQELSRLDATTRTALRGVERTTEPEDESGAPIAANERAIRDELIALHLALHGERVQDGDADLEASFALFTDVWRAGKARVAAGDERDDLPSRCEADSDFWDAAVSYPAEGEAGPGAVHETVDDDSDYVVRAWQAVFIYLLSDPRFFLEP